jgi:hypothetical protein
VKKYAVKAAVLILSIPFKALLTVAAMTSDARHAVAVELPRIEMATCVIHASPLFIVFIVVSL